MNERDIASLHGQDLRTLNKLWLHYSQGKFGFSMQKRIWQQINMNELEEAYKSFAITTGWYVEGGWKYYSDFTFSLKALPGHLPALVMAAPYFYSFEYRYQLNEPVFKILMERQYLN